MNDADARRKVSNARGESLLHYNVEILIRKNMKSKERKLWINMVYPNKNSWVVESLTQPMIEFFPDLF